MRRWMVAALWAAALSVCGCGSNRDGTETSTDPDALLGGNQAMPAGIVGQPYEASVAANGGVPPIRYEVAYDSALPLGLSLDGRGRIAGVPAEAGVKATQIVASDAVGQTQRFLATFDMDLIPTLLDCGDGIEGTFTESAIRTSGPDWTAVTTENLQWLGIPWPQGDNQRIEIVVESETTVGVLVQRPNQPEGSLDWRQDYVSTWVGADSGTVVELDPGTLPSLPAYEPQGIVPVLIVAFGPGAYRLDVACSDGPVFERILPYPVRLGEAFEIDFDVYGDNSDITFTIDGDLPDWVEVDEAEGSLSGVAEARVTVPLELTATTADGRSTTADSIFAVYDPQPIGCDESRTLTFEQGYYDGPIIGYYDPRGYEVLELEVPADVSAVGWSLDGADGQFIGLVEHDEERYFFFAGGDADFASSGPARVEVTPRTYAATKHYRDVGTMYAVAAPTESGRELQITTTCDRGPRPNLAGLPVVEPLVETDRPLRGIGGVPPYTFEADGLPFGLSVSGDRLVGSSTEVGRHDVELTVTDSSGASSTDRYDLFVGLDEACEGGTRVGCGDVLSGSFSGTFFEDPSTQAEVRLCLYPDDAPAAGLEFSSDGGEFRIDIGDPGVRSSRFLDDPDDYTYGGVVFDDDTEGVALNAFSWPARPDYEGLPVHLGMRAVEPGDWSVRVECQAP